MTSPSTATTILVLAGGGLLAVSAFTLGKRWEAKKDAPWSEVAIALAPGVAMLAYAWYIAGENRPNPIQAMASGIRGASRGGI